MKQTFCSIQALRGLAASLVVIAHIFEHPSRGDPNALLLTGRLGVEIFFVISGFVMTHVAGEGIFAPGAFAFRRMMRIVPLYWVCTLLVFAVALVAPALFKTTTADAKHLVLSPFFIPAPDPQAATDWRPLFKLGWTLNYEMFLYAALLLLFWCRGVLQMIGDSSYSLYLTHMLVVGAARTAVERIDLPKALHWGLTPLIFAAALVTAYCSYRVVELPFNRLAHRLTRRPMRTAMAE